MNPPTPTPTPTLDTWLADPEAKGIGIPASHMGMPIDARENRRPPSDIAGAGQIIANLEAEVNRLRTAGDAMAAGMDQLLRRQRGGMWTHITAPPDAAAECDCPPCCDKRAKEARAAWTAAKGETFSHEVTTQDLAAVTQDAPQAAGA